MILLVGLVALVGAAAVLAWLRMRARGLDRWLVQYVREMPRRQAPQPGQPIHVLLCIADHFEPNLHGAAPEVARGRVRTWVENYPRLFGSFRDSDGRPPQHSFFYPLEDYDAAHLDALAGLCQDGFGEVEVHLHHEGDTPERLRQRLIAYKELLAQRHGLLSRDRDTGALAYGFIHGNWALDNSRPDGRWCGVNNELDILRESGCYADFTLPSAPEPTQTRKINSIYYACDDPARPKSHDWGIDVGTALRPANSLMLIQGPLLLDWHRRKWGLLPGIENGCLQGNQAPTMRRLDLWLKARVHVFKRPDWIFVKLHTHGAKEANQRMLLGEPMLRFHEALRQRSEANPNFHVHYVTARQLHNLARAAEHGWQGSVEEARDFRFVSLISAHTPLSCRGK